MKQTVDDVSSGDLVDWIQQSRKLGMSDQDIVNELLKMMQNTHERTRGAAASKG